jgi:hypothetical protein
MVAKKASTARPKGKSAASRRKRNPEGVSIFWGGGDAAKSAKDGGGKNGGNPLPPVKPAGQRRKSAKGGGGNHEGSPRRERNPAEESEEVRKANELLLRVWENIHAKRDRFGKFD